MIRDLITWLRAQLDDDERVARASAEGEPGEWTRGPIYDGDTATVRDHNDSPAFDGALRVADAEHIARWDPARVLAEVDAKRRMLPFLEEGAKGGVWGMKTALCLLALPYADRPGYDESWRPS